MNNYASLAFIVSIINQISQIEIALLNESVLASQ